MQPRGWTRGRGVFAVPISFPITRFTLHKTRYGARDWNSEFKIFSGKQAILLELLS